MSDDNDEPYRFGPELIRVVDIAGTRDLTALQDIVALVHAAGGKVHAPFNPQECTFYELFDEEYEDSPICPTEIAYLVSPTVVLTEKDIKVAISSLNGYFEYSRFFSYAPGGWIEEGGFVHQIEATKPVGVKVIQLQFEREFISRLNIPDGKTTASSSSEFGFISEELERFGSNKVRADDWSEETRINHQSIFDTFVEIVGDQPVEALSRADINTYLDVLDTLPPNRKKVKTFRNLDAKSASTLNAEMGGKSLAKKTKNNYIKRLSEPFEEFVIGKVFTYNYFTVAKSYSITKEEELDARNPWSPEDIKIIIESDEAIKLLSKAKHQVSKPWALLICMFTGARIGELLSLPLSGVDWDDDVPFFDIKVRPGHSRLKKPASIRRIPVHPTLIDLGFLEYVEQARKLQRNVEMPMLFTDVRKTVKHGWGRATEDWLNNSFYTKLGIKTDKKVTHSFRHNISNFFRRANGVSQLKVSAYMGHADEHKKRPEWQKSYGSPYTPKELLDITKHICYDVDFSNLKANCLKKLTPRLDRGSQKSS